MQRAEYIGERIGLQPKCLTVTPIYERRTVRSPAALEKSMKNLEKKRTGMMLSAKSKKNISKAINWMAAAASSKRCYSTKLRRTVRWRINLVTLTLPDDAREYKEKELQENLLQPWLSNLRKNYSLGNYIWKIERTAVGTLHVHITTDTYLQKDMVRKTWNRLVAKAGLLDKFKLEYGHVDPPSTRVEIPIKVKNIAGYLAKELAKNVHDGVSNGGRLWGCNYELSKAKNTSVVIDPHTARDILYVPANGGMHRKDIYSKPDAMGRTMQLAMLLFPKARDWISGKLGILESIYADTISYVRSHIEQVPLWVYEELDNGPRHLQVAPAKVQQFAPQRVTAPVFVQAQLGF